MYLSLEPLMHRIKRHHICGCLLVGKRNNMMYSYWWRVLFFMSMSCMKVNNVELYAQVYGISLVNYSWPQLFGYLLDRLRWIPFPECFLCGGVDECDDRALNGYIFVLFSWFGVHKSVESPTLELLFVELFFIRIKKVTGFCRSSDEEDNDWNPIKWGEDRKNRVG